MVRVDSDNFLAILPWNSFFRSKSTKIMNFKKLKQCFVWFPSSVQWRPFRGSKGHLGSFKDTVTILKFLWIFELFSNRRFCRDNAQDINSICLVHNYWVRSLLFWGQTRWVIPMTSSTVVSKDLVKNSKKWKSQNTMNKSKFWLRICFYIMNTSNNIFFDSPKPYRKVRKFTMDRN